MHQLLGKQPKVGSRKKKRMKEKETKVNKKEERQVRKKTRKSSCYHKVSPRIYIANVFVGVSERLNRERVRKQKHTFTHTHTYTPSLIDGRSRRNHLGGDLACQCLSALNRYFT